MNHRSVPNVFSSGHRQRLLKLADHWNYDIYFRCGLIAIYVKRRSPIVSGCDQQINSGILEQVINIAEVRSQLHCFRFYR